MLYDQPISLLHVKQPLDSILTVLVITGVPSRGIIPIVSGFKTCAQQFIACGLDCQGFGRTSMFQICKDSRRKPRQACRTTVTSS